MESKTIKNTKLNYMYKIAALSTCFLLISCDLGSFSREESSSSKSSSTYVDTHQHDLVKVEAKASTCKTIGNKEYYICKECGKMFNTDSVNVEIEDVSTPKSEHEYIEKIYTKTCTENGYTRHICYGCGDYYDDNIDYATGHEKVYHDGKSSSYSENGYKAYETCKKCDYTTFEIIPKGAYYDAKNYASTYGFEYLGTLTNGKALQNAYKLLDTASLVFHNGNDDASSYNDSFLKAFSVNVSSAGTFTTDELKVVSHSYQYDHPLFYWMNNFARTNTEIIVLTYNEFASATDRSKYNSIIYDYVAKNAYKYESDYAYYSALGIHDLICDSISYAYDEDGYASKDIIHHSILGFFTSNKGVCECYSKTFQLFMNIYGYDCIYVVGNANNKGKKEDHAWNLLKLDDGKYYWIDVTWDDNDDGYTHNFFAKCDGDYVNVQDYYGYIDNQTFVLSHVAFIDESDVFLYDLPKTSKLTYKSNNVWKLYEKYEVDNVIYVPIKYNEACVVEFTNNEDIIIKDKISYLGNSCKVTTIGGIDVSNALGLDSVESLGRVQSLKIGKNIKNIFVGAFNFRIYKIDVDCHNENLIYEKGLLLSTNKDTIYAINSSLDKLTIPETVNRIAGADPRFSGDIYYSGDPKTSADALDDFRSYFLTTKADYNTLPPIKATYHVAGYEDFTID